MIAIDNTIISDNLHRIKFICDLEKCHGACCVEGDAGAPLEAEELSDLEDNYLGFKAFMTEEGIKEVENNGFFELDPAGHFVTPLVNGKECAYVYFEGDIACCAIEKAWQQGLVTFRKPVSCHLYPVRIRNYADYDAVNYHEWHVCHPAILLGKKEGVKLYEFLKDSLIRKYGQAWYDSLVSEIEA